MNTQLKELREIIQANIKNKQYCRNWIILTPEDTDLSYNDGWFDALGAVVVMIKRMEAKAGKGGKKGKGRRIGGKKGHGKKKDTTGLGLDGASGESFDPGMGMVRTSTDGKINT